MNKEPSMPVPSGQTDEIALAILALAESIKAGQTSGANDKLDKMVQLLSEREEARPHENLFNPPMLSHYNPLGERDNPRPELACETAWVGMKLTKDCLTRQEIELLNRVTPGDYRVTKSDGHTIPFKVTEKISDSGKRERISISFPCKSSEDRQNHLSMVSYLQEVLGETESAESLRAQIETLRQQLRA